jgi:hypothetical protein
MENPRPGVSAEAALPAHCGAIRAGSPAELGQSNNLPTVLAGSKDRFCDHEETSPINILAFHAFVTGGQGLLEPMLIVIVVLAACLLWVGRKAFAGLLN